jgi:hypothetical protein
MTVNTILYAVLFTVATAAVVILAATDVLSKDATYALVAALVGHLLGVPVRLATKSG